MAREYEPGLYRRYVVAEGDPLDPAHSSCWHEYDRDMEAEHNEALGFVTRSGDWGAESWESVANDPLLYAHRPGLVIRAKAIAAEIRRQEAER